MADPVRFPEQWSPAWFRRFYVEVIARQSVPVGARVLTATDPVEVYGFGVWTLLGSGDVCGVTVSMYERTS